MPKSQRGAAALSAAAPAMPEVIRALDLPNDLAQACWAAHECAEAADHFQCDAMAYGDSLTHEEAGFVLWQAQRMLMALRHACEFLHPVATELVSTRAHLGGLHPVGPICADSYHLTAMELCFSLLNNALNVSGADTIFPRECHPSGMPPLLLHFLHYPDALDRLASRGFQPIVENWKAVRDNSRDIFPRTTHPDWLLAMIRQESLEAKSRRDGSRSPDVTGAGGKLQENTSAYCFRRDGDVWEIRFDGTGARFTNIDGFAYIWQLLRNPAKQISAIQLMRDIKPVETSRSVVSPLENIYSEETTSSLVAKRDGVRGPDRIMDPETVSQIEEEIKKTQRNISELQADIESANRCGDEPQAERLTRDELYPEQKKLGKLTQELARAKGLGRKIRQLGTSDIDKARQTVRQAIKAAFERLKSHGLQLCAEHLDRHIPPAQSGMFVYHPLTPPLDWNLEKVQS